MRIKLYSFLAGLFMVTIASDGAAPGIGSAYLVNWSGRKVFNVNHTYENATAKLIY